MRVENACGFWSPNHWTANFFGRPTIGQPIWRGSPTALAQRILDGYACLVASIAVQHLAQQPEKY